MSKPGDDSPVPSLTMHEILLAAPDPVERGQSDQQVHLGGFLHRWYIGELEHWKSFQHDVFELYHSEGIQNALATRESVSLESRKDSHTEPCFKASPVKPHTKVGFYTQFLHQVLGPCKTIARLLLDPDLDPKAHNLTSLSKDLQVDISDPRINANELSHLIYTMEVHGETRLAGYLDALGARVNPIQQIIDDPLSQRIGSLRYILGNIVYSMVTKGLRYAFFSCYDETIFLRIDIVQSSDRPEYFPRICYSSFIDSDAELDQTNGNITVPLRLAMVYVMKLAIEDSLPATAVGAIRPQGYTALVEGSLDLDNRGRRLSKEDP
ncbi:hypothetical protein K491DRAFT_709978 [Lophiostoma macrostomum CBS 122681]|uniref:Uncharacterized protein n=1 Tax=Lophiostoma macrostomum CBS 122681 TaxID=1314788 RepID=A0A6A6TVI7_9PLEO|nr:hypothetical protein K491DRAFT_709978 [Lophiostoma macrostomum CBS 122681]